MGAIPSGPSGVATTARSDSAYRFLPAATGFNMVNTHQFLVGVSIF